MKSCRPLTAMIFMSLCSHIFAEDQSLNIFWKKFRAAATQGEIAQITSLTQLPLLLHGVTDDEPIVKCDPTCIGSRLPDLLAQTIYVPTKAGVEPRTMQEIIEAQASVAPDLPSDQTHFRLQQFLFTKTAKGWRWTDAYLEE